MQVGYVGLLKAINNFDPAFGRGLHAYAVPCITGEVKRHFRDKRWQVRVTRPLQELLLEMRGAVETLTHELGRHPADAELAARLGVTEEELREARQASEGFAALSLDAPMAGRDDPGELASLLGEEDPAVDRTVDMAALAQHWDAAPSVSSASLSCASTGTSPRRRSPDGSASRRCTSRASCPARWTSSGAA